MDSPENSGFDEMSGTLSMGWNMDGLQSTPGTRTQQAHGAWGTECFGSAQAFVGLGFGAHAKG